MGEEIKIEWFATELVAAMNAHSSFYGFTTHNGLFRFRVEASPSFKFWHAKVAYSGSDEKGLGIVEWHTVGMFTTCDFAMKYLETAFNNRAYPRDELPLGTKKSVEQ